MPAAVFGRTDDRTGDTMFVGRQITVGSIPVIKTLGGFMGDHVSESAIAVVILFIIYF